MKQIGKLGVIITTNRWKIDSKKYLSGLERYRAFQEPSPSFLKFGFTLFTTRVKPQK